MRLSTCLAVATAIVAPAKAIIQHPVSVYLLPSPEASPSIVKPPTLDGDEAFDVFANHFGVGSQSTFEKYQKKSWAHLVDPSHSSELTGEEQAKVIIIQGDLSPSDILPPTYQDSLADFELPSFPSYETMNFLQPFMIRGQKVVGHVLGENQDGLEEGFDKVWSNVKGSQVGKKMASAFDLNTSLHAQALHAELQALSALAMNLPVDARLERNRNVWDSVVISSLGNNDSTGVDAEVREMGLNVIRASLQALAANPKQPRVVLVVVPTTSGAAFAPYVAAVKKFFTRLTISSDRSILLGFLPTLFSSFGTIGSVLLLLLSLPVLLVAGNVFRQKVLPRDPTLPPLVFHYIPWFGSAATYGMDPYKFLFDCREQYGDLFTFILLGRKMTVALGPKGNNLILGGKLSQVSAEDAYTHLTTPVFGKGVVYDCPNEMLMQQKRMVKFGLSTENFRVYVPLIKQETLDFLGKDLKPSNEWKGFNALHAMAELTILTASATLQGKEVRGKLDKTFAKRYEALDGGFTPINFMFPNLPLPSYKRRDKAQAEMSEFYQSIIRGRREGASEHDHDMIAALMASTYRDGTPLSDSDIAHMMIALLMAGQHTSSATSSWTLLHLADRPDVYAELYEEQKEKFGNPDGTFRDMTYEDLKDLPKLDSVIRETLRMHAPIHSIMRKVMTDMPVPNALAAPTANEKSSYIVPKGHFVLASPGVAQMDPLIWSDASIWNPHRWTDEKGMASQALEEYTSGDKVDYGYGSVSKGTESPYQPFGAGRHRCIGETFAYLQLQTILATFIRNVEMKLDGPFPKTNYQTMVVLPLPGTKILYRNRK